MWSELYQGIRLTWLKQEQILFYEHTEIVGK